VQEVVSHTKVVVICGPKADFNLPYEKFVDAINYLDLTNRRKELEQHYHEGKNFMAFVQAVKEANWIGTVSS
jgi:hypothetical protein